ncbi:MAG: squalene--hopene cyclase, partial [Planctomycetota bacterium]
MICLVLSIGLHAALIYLVPYETTEPGGRDESEQDQDLGVTELTFSNFDLESDVDEVSGQKLALVEPLPVDDWEELTDEGDTTDLASEDASPDQPDPDKREPDQRSISMETEDAPIAANAAMPAALSGESSSAASIDSMVDQLANSLDQQLDQWIQSQLQPIETTDGKRDDSRPSDIPEAMQAESAASASRASRAAAPNASVASQARRRVTNAEPATVPGGELDDFANRQGSAKTVALQETGGDVVTEAAVKAALRFLAASQRPDGAWDPKASNAGVERMPLGERRIGAGTKCTTGITGLSLLAMMGSGQTHLQGEHSDTVFRGLAYLIQNQNPDGSLSGDATIYAASYCHSMAALAMAEAAVMTGDPSAIESARRAIAYTQRMQHPVTGGWRYTKGDPGDLSQLGWQAMVLEAGKRAGVDIDRSAMPGVARFLRRVRTGRGGRACYRPGEATSRTMTAEALATRLLIGQDVPRIEIEDATSYLLEKPPGVGQANYYYWYYATLALHQLQGEAWERWNASLKQTLIGSQRADG